MEEFHLFLNNVRKCQDERNDGVLKGILQECRRNFQNLSATDCELALSIIFDENLGLLKFVYNELDEVQRARMDSSVKEGFHLLDFIATEFRGPFKNYCLAAKEICHFALIGKCNLYIKRAACRFFQTLIKMYKNENLELEKNVKDFRKKFVLLGVKERSTVLAVLGTIAKHCPECVQEDDAKSIYKYLMADCNQTRKCPSPPPEVELYLETWADMLDSCSPAARESEEFKTRYKMLYPWIKDLSWSTLDRERKHVMRKAIELLIRHITSFQELVYQDYQDWHNLFLSLLTQTFANRDTGIKAIRVFYEMIGNMLRQKNSYADKQIFLYFENYFMRLFNRNLNENELRQVVHGVSQLAAAYKIHSTVEAVDKIYSLILRRTMFLYSRSNELTRFDDLPYYQEALSTIMCEMSVISVEQINSLTKLCTLLVKQFAKLSITTQTFAAESLIGTIVRLRNIPKNLYQQFLHNLIYDGLIWTCSHTLLIDAELERDAKNLQELPLCYKHYWPLWKTLLNSQKYGTQYQLLQEVFDEMISCCVTIISKLDLNVKPKTDDVYSDDDFSKIAVNETDFRIFLNLVDLYVDIFEACGSLPHLIENWLNRFLCAIIKTSYRHPLISGFYKLVRQAIKMSDVFQDKDKLEAHQDTVTLVEEYLSEVLDLVCSFSEELQITCVYLILDAPMTFVENILDRASGILKIAFTTGLSNFSLASSALKTLTRWTNNFGNDRTKNLLLRVVPHLEPFLCSRETSVEMLQDILKTQRKVVKRVTLVNEENTLENFQKNILIFLGSLDSEITLAFVHERSLNTGATWDKKNLLKYTLPYPDIKLDIYLDNGLSRIVELALHSADRRTKVVAAEVLHSVVAVLLDKTRQKSGQQRDNFASIYNTLLPTLLRLGCDSDDVVRQVFHPLMLQLIHWLGKEEMLCSSITSILVDAIFDGIDHESNSSLKEFSGKCLAEFVEWSMMSTEKQFAKTFDNVIGILNKMTSFSLHPSARKRVAAAIAFNHLYRILREYGEIVDIFWLEILYCFVKSLVGCNDSRIGTALRHVERVLIAKANVFNKDNRERRRPVEFGGSTLKDAADWLFLQCSNTDRNCRNKCMELLEKISLHVPCYNSTKNVISYYNDANGVKALNSMILKNLNEKNYTVISLESLQSLLRALDCYIWLIGKDLVNFEILFATENGNGYLIFDCVQNFIHCLLHVKSKNFDEASVLSSELETVKVIKCEIVIVILKFVETLLIIMNEHQETNVPTSFWSKGLFTLISSCVLEPQALGFNEKNLKITETLPRQVENLFLTMKESKINFIFDSLKDTISVAVMEKYQEIFELDTIIKKNNPALNNSVRGLTLLRKSSFLDKIFEEQNIDASWTQKKLIDLFNALRTDSFNVPACTILDPDTKEYFENLMQLLLITYDAALVKKLLNLILNNTTLENLDSTRIQHGYYFLLVLKNPIFHHMLKNVEEIVPMLQDQLLYNNPAELLMILKEIMAFLLNRKKELRPYFEKLTKILLEMCPLLKKSINNLPSRKDMFLNIYITLVKIMETPVIIARERTYLYEWILDELRSSDNLEYKTQLLENFSVGLIDAESDSDNELFNVLKVIKNTHLPQSVKDSSVNDAEHLKIREYFDTLSKLLPVVKSKKFFESVMLFAAGTGNFLCDEKITDSLNPFFEIVPCECALKSVDVAFRNFMDLDNQQVRMDILYSFLIPSFDKVKLEIVEEFFENNLTEVSAVTNQSLAGCEVDTRRLILTKVGCYDLLGIMFTKLSDDKIESMKVDKTMLIMSAMKVRSFKTYSNENKELMRLLHCSAYNYCVARVSLKNDEKMYNLLFGENREKGQLIWENIIDCEKRYTFRQSFKETLKKRKRHVNIRKKKESANDHHARHSYLYSFDLASCTLTEDMNSYDYNDVSLKSPLDGSGAQERMSVALESDDLNDHECMASICAVIRHMMSNGIFSPFNESFTSQSKEEMPEWLKNFYNAFTYSLRSKRHNVAYFILKVILNVPEAFKPYGKFFLAPIVTVINICFEDYDMNDFITDALVMLRNWKDVAVPAEVKEKLEAQKFFEAIIGRTKISPSNLYKFKMKIINILVESWNQCLTLPANLNDKMESSPHVAVDLILIFVKNKMVDSVVRRESILNHLQNSVGKWKEDKEVPIRACESLGIVLNFMKDKVDYEDKKNGIVDNLSRIFRNVFQVSKDTVIKCIHALCIKYESAVEKYFHFIRSCVQKVDQALKSKCLEVLLVLIPKLTPDNISAELNHVNFKYLLKLKISSCEKVQLQIVSLLAKRLGPTNLLELAKLIASYAKHDLSQYREMTYEIFISIHNRFYHDISEDSDRSELLLFATKILLDGLMDPSEDLQKKLLEFWTEENSGNKKLTERCTDRLLEVLNMYSPELEKVYLHILPMAMLQLTSKTPDFNAKMCEPLDECQFIPYQIDVTCKTKNLASVAPLFANSHASQKNYSFAHSTQTLQNLSTYSISSTSKASNSNFAPRNALAFDPTIDEELDDFEVPEVTPVPEFKKPKELRESLRASLYIQEASKTREEMRLREIKKNERHKEMRKMEKIRQRNTVKMTKEYTLGDYPDISIPNSSLLQPLQKLATRDHNVCKFVIVSIFRSLIETMGGINSTSEYRDKVSQSLKFILENCRKQNPLMATILEITWSTNITDFCSDNVAKAAKSNQLLSLGALILEEKLIKEDDYTGPPLKKQRNSITHHDPRTNEWVQLASLYESMNEVDVVLSIFSERVSGKSLQEATFARAANDWTTAKDAYLKAYEVESGSIQEHCLEGYYECLAHLLCWKAMAKSIKQNLNNDYNNIWKPSWQEDWIVPWMFSAHVQLMLKGQRIDSSTQSNSFEEALMEWMKDKNKCDHIKRYYGEEVAILLDEDNRAAQLDCLNGALEGIREQWIHLNPLSASQRIRLLLKLQGINEVHVYLKYSKEPDDFSRIRKLLNYWNHNVPSVHDDLITSSKLTTYRIHFAEVLGKKLANELDSQDDNIQIELRNLCYKQKLKMADAALFQKNLKIVKFHSYYTESHIEEVSDDLRDEFQMVIAKYNYLEGILKKTNSEKLKSYEKSWIQTEKLVKEYEKPHFKVLAAQHMAMLADTLVNLSINDEIFYTDLKAKEHIVNTVSTECVGSNDLIEKLHAYSLSCLRKSCNLANEESIGHCYLKLSKYCHARITNPETDFRYQTGNPNDLIQEFVRSTLRAMSYGLPEAAHYFPCMLKTEYLENEETREIFTRESRDIQAWLFLAWQAQLLSHLGSSITPTIIPIIEKIVNTYPNAMVYTFRLTAETNPAILDDPLLFKVREILTGDRKIEYFLTAIEYLAQPELYLRDQLTKFLTNLKHGRDTALQTLLKKVLPHGSGDTDSPARGSLYEHINVFREQIEKIRNYERHDAILQYVTTLQKRLREALINRENKIQKGPRFRRFLGEADEKQLKSYSPWLHEIPPGEIEIPGQYTGDRRPMPKYHAKIMRFESTVQIMSSLRRPMKVTMIGDDARNYYFLVKHGEDLRLDQRIQQLFAVMNNALKVDTACRKRQLLIDTYQVTPLSTSVGLIQWIDDTKRLCDFIDFALDKKQQSQHKEALERYSKWISKAAPNLNLTQQYKKALNKYSAEEVQTKMAELTNACQADSLRDTFKLLSSSPESFTALRHNFVTSYATMCVAQWILGIGDRHLENTLISVKSGRSLGIDFGLAFGAGIDLPIPELTPFRLTPQIVGLLKPFDENDLLESTMIHAMDALRQERSPLLACMDIFVHEPLKWTEHVNKLNVEIGQSTTGKQYDIIDIKWLPEKKIRTVMEKLNGGKPSLIVWKQLKDYHNDEYLARYEAILCGLDENHKRKRATMKDKNLSVKEQVECLLDQATDPNILGRSYAYWKPWL